MHGQNEREIKRALGVRRRRFPRRIFAYALCVLFFVGFLLIDCFVFPVRHLNALCGAPKFSVRKQGEMRVHFADVGQGDAIILQLPDGKTALIDGGKESSVQNLLCVCFALGVKRFDYVLLSHTDSDHCGALPEVLRVFGANTVYLPRSVYEGRKARFVLDSAQKYADRILEASALRTVVSADRSAFYWMQFLSPLREDDWENENDRSAVLYVEYAGRRLLFTGDASAAAEEKLIDDYFFTQGEAFVREVDTPFGPMRLKPRLENIDFLKAGHHGSADSTGKVLAEFCRPEAAFFCCGVGNSYEHPSLSSLENLLEARADTGIYRTDELGTITLAVEHGGSYSVEYTGKR